MVLAGEGAVFCAGADVEWMRSAIGLSLAENERDAAAMQAMFTAIDACPVPVIARVHGAALGGGMGLCAVADIVVGGTGDTVFGFTETKLGIMPAVISTFVLPKIGESRRARCSRPASGSTPSARAAIGLVHEVVPTRRRSTRASRRCWPSCAPPARRRRAAAKALVRELRTIAPDEARAAHRAPHRPAADIGRGPGGAAAFLEKRPPTWASED